MVYFFDGMRFRRQPFTTAESKRAGGVPFRAVEAVLDAIGPSFQALPAFNPVHLLVWFTAARRQDDSLRSHAVKFGDLVTSPESKVPKTYLVKSSELLNDTQLDQLRAGVELADGPTRPAIVERIRDSARYTFFEITITEGRYRQVRRMVDALGATVLKLVRVRIGPLAINGLEIGKHRSLTPEEIHEIYGFAAARRKAKTEESSASV